MELEKPTVVCCLYAASGLGHFPRKARSKVFRLGGKRPTEHNQAALPSKRRILMFSETDFAHGFKKNGEEYEKTVLQESSLLPTEQARMISLENDISMSRKGKGKMVQEMGPQTPSPSKWMSRSEEKKVESGCYYTQRRSLELEGTYFPCKRRSLISNETNMAIVESKEIFNSRQDKDGSDKIEVPAKGKGMRVSFKKLKKNKKKIGKFGLNVEREVTEEWYELLSGVPQGNVDGVWPEVLFITKVGKIQGPRLYRPWKGSVVDSVAGALLTQRVGDNISSSAFMSLSMNFPQDPDCDQYSRHHRILRQKRSNACSHFDSAYKMGNVSNFGKQRRIPVGEMKWRESKNGKNPEEEDEFDWKLLREYEGSARDADKVDSVDWHAIMRSNVNDVAKAISVRGMNQKLAIRIKDFLKRLLLDYGNLDLEWLRNIPPQKAKEFLLSIHGIGMKSTECVRLLTLRQPAFPVDVNVARVTVRLGWVPAPAVRDDILMGLLKQNSKLHDLIHEYLWRRLDTHFSKDILYELHCQMITFGKVFCTTQKPNCGECPMRLECSYFSNLANSSSPSPCIQEMNIEDMGSSRRRTVTKAKSTASTLKSKRATCKVKEADTDYLPVGYIEGPKTPVKVNVPLLRCRSTTLKNTSLKARQSRGSKTRTEHFIYELSDLHPFLETFDDRDPDDPSPYLLVPWETDGEASANKSPSTDRVRGSQSVRGTIMIPCRTALRGNFPLNATHFQPNEVFADWQTSQIPFEIPLRTLDGCPRKQLYCGSSLTSIVKGRSAKDIRKLFHEGYICTRSFDRETYATRALDGGLHKSSNTRKRSFKA